MWSSIGIKAGMFVIALALALWLGWSGPMVLQENPVIETQAPRTLIKYPVQSTLTVNLNQATAKDLQELPGIGPVLAQRILMQRERVGAFGSLEELLAVKGVGEKRLERIRPFLHLESKKQRAAHISLINGKEHERRVHTS